MPGFDQYESVFKAAAKPDFRYEKRGFRKALVVTDLAGDPERAFVAQLASFLHTLGDVTFRHVPPGETRSAGGLVELVEREAPDLVCTYRNLHAVEKRWPYSLGEHLDVLTQTTKPPVLVLPHPDASGAISGVENTDIVMAMTDHLAGDSGLVNAAAAFTEPEGTLHLAHVEDQATFDRFMDAIGKIASIDTETARTEILRRLLKDPQDFVRSCREAMAAAGLKLNVVETVTVGRRLAEVKRLIDEHRVDLLVIHTKDRDQLAMHGMAYPLAIELRTTPLLML